jgi:hypothetical protein
VLNVQLSLLAATISWQEREKQKMREQLMEIQEMNRKQVDKENGMDQTIEIPVMDKKISKIYFASRTQKQIEQVIFNIIR